MTTLADADDARAMAIRLVETKLAACVQILPVASVYRWEGRVEEARELLLLCKIVASDFAAIEAAIRAGHPYDVPEILLVPVGAGHQPYLDWLAAR